VGSYVTLQLGNLEVDWGKNNVFMDHGPLFQPQDETEVDYQYVEDTGEPFVRRQTALSRPLGDTVERLALLGHTPDTARTEFDGLRRFFQPTNGDAGPSFEQLFEALGRLDLTDSSLSADTELDDFGELAARPGNPRGSSM
jgi:hypothetical protein